MLNCYCTLNP